MTGLLWILAAVVGPILLGLFIYLGARQSETFSRDRAAVERQQRSVRANYGGDRRASPTMPVALTTGRRPLVLATSIALALALTSALTWVLTRDASDRSELPQMANNETSKAGLPVTQPETRPQGAADEGSCRTTPGGGQADGPHEMCAFIAANVPVMAQNTSDLARPAVPGSTRALRPGDDMPSDVRALLPLPDAVTAKYPDLRGSQYFLDGQNIVVVGAHAKVAFVIDVKVRP